MTDEVRVEGGAKELEDRPTLGFTSVDGGPDAFGPALAFVTASALGDTPVDDEATDSLRPFVPGMSPSRVSVRHE